MDWQDSWRRWRLGNLNGDVPWDKQISPNSVFPRIMYEADIPAYLAHIRGDADDGITAVAIPAVSQQAANNVVDHIRRKQAPPLGSASSAARTCPSITEKILSKDRNDSTGGGSSDLKGKRVAPPITSPVDAMAFSPGGARVGRALEEPDIKREASFASHDAPGNVGRLNSADGNPVRSSKPTATPRKRASTETIGSVSDTFSAGTDAFGSNATTSKSINIPAGALLTCMSGAAIPTPSPSLRPGSSGANLSLADSPHWVVYAGITTGMFASM